MMRLQHDAYRMLNSFPGVRPVVESLVSAQAYPGPNNVIACLCPGASSLDVLSLPSRPGVRGFLAFTLAFCF
jgi:hypothetical protein